MARVPAGVQHLHLVADLLLDRGIVDRIRRFVAQHPGPLQIATEVATLQLETNATGELPWDSAMARLTAERSRRRWPREHFVCLLTPTPNDQHWFCLPDRDGGRSAIVHVDDWGWITSAPLEAATSYNLVQAVALSAAIASKLDLIDIVHGIRADDPHRGCLADFCADKSQIVFKLRTADICGDCLARAESMGVPEAILRQLVSVLEACRRSALGTARYLEEPRPTSDAWPFPVAVTKDKAVQTRDPVERFSRLIDHFDSMVRFACIARAALEGKNIALGPRPSLGDWVQQLRQGTADPATHEAVRMIEAEGIVHLRNEYKGHGYVRSPSEYSDMNTHLEGVLTDLAARLLSPLLRTPLVIVRGTDLEDGRHVLFGHRATGSNSMFRSWRQQLPEGVDAPRAGIDNFGALALWDETAARCHPLHPFLREEICPACRHPRILVWDGDQYIDVQIGHRVRLDA